MIWPEARCPGPWLRTACFCLFLAALCVPLPAFGQEEEEAQAWLLTYGPGQIYWQRFGHNAIWIRDPAFGLDHTFNFGFFDFAQEGFLRNFVMGRLNYFAAARPAQVELAEYIDQDRSIRAQRLALDAPRIRRLAERLLAETSPETREYLYDYYRHNCSTRIRDALDFALDGALGDALEEVPASQTYRDHTRRLTGMDFWLYLGLETGLGSPVDRPISRWDETFIPGVLAGAMEGLSDPETGRPVVVEDVLLYKSSLAPPPAAPQSLWQRYLPIPAILLIAAVIVVKALRRPRPRHLALAWLTAAGLLGAVLCFLWFFTDHWVSRLNLNLLLLNPLWLLIAAVPALRGPGAWLIAGCGLLGLLAPWLPPGQYNAEVVALVLPLNLAAAVSLLTRPSASKLRE